MSETLYAFGAVPVGAAEIVGYDRVVACPATPPGVTDVGFQNDPNLELLSRLKPDVILIQSWQNGGRPTLERFAPVESFTLYARGDGDPLSRSIAVAERLGELSGRAAESASFVRKTDDTFAECGLRLAAFDQRPLLLVQALSPTNLVVFTSGSLFDSVIKRIGLVNAWSRPPTLLWGSTQIGVDALWIAPEAHIVWIASPDGVSSEGLFRSALWQRLPQVKAGRVHGLPLVWGFGALPTAERFARLVTNQLLGAKE